MTTKIVRPTAMAAALFRASEKKVDHAAQVGAKPSETWVARRVLLQAEHSRIGVVVEPSTVVK